jgi:hypothetical protein
MAAYSMPTLVVLLVSVLITHGYAGRRAVPVTAVDGLIAVEVVETAAYSPHVGRLVGIAESG